MRFRVTDEMGWEFPFEASDPDELASGVKRGWDAYIEAHRHEKAPPTHPALALGARMVEINLWLAQRLSREGATEEQVRSWKAQAQHWRFTARSQLGGLTASPLRLHVFGDASGLWLTPTCIPPAPRVPRALTDEQAALLIQQGQSMVEHDRNLQGLLGAVDQTIAETLRKSEVRPLHVVDDPEKNPNDLIKASLLEW